MDKQGLQKLFDRYQRKADKAYQNYQETGIQRYQNEWHNNEDLTDALLIAINAANDHNKLISLQADVSILAGKRYTLEPEEFVDQFMAMASVHGLTDGREKFDNRNNPR